MTNKKTPPPPPPPPSLKPREVKDGVPKQLKDITPIKRQSGD